MVNSLAKSVVFITGTFIGNNCWDEWKLYFESKGYTCLSPAWPYKNASPEELRNRHPDIPIASNTLATLIDFFSSLINSLPERPILIGHGLGGLVVQLILQRELGAAGVAIHSFPPLCSGISKLLFLKAVWKAMGLFTSARETYMISFRKWRRSMANGMSCKDQKELFYKYAIPESKLVTRDVFKTVAQINFKKPHVPLLFISGSSDRIISASMNFNNYKKYTMRNSIAGYKNFKDHNHLVFGHPVWKEEADYILHWLQALK